MNNLAPCFTYDSYKDLTSFSTTDSKQTENKTSEKPLSKSICASAPLKHSTDKFVRFIKDTSVATELNYVDLFENSASISIDSGEELEEEFETNKNVLKNHVVEELENEFFCTIDSVDADAKELEASVYDIKENIQVMSITVPFSEFLDSEVNKIVPNAGFYWRIGTRKIVKELTNKTITNSETFSDFRMRLTYVSSRALKGRLDNNYQKYSTLFD